LKAYIELMHWERYLKSDDFAGLYDRVRRTRVADCKPSEEDAIRICSAVNWACAWYWKQVQCLQRSAALSCLLRRHGFAARLVIGAQQIPFRAHAWVELNHQVINDKIDRIESYRVLERC
jgi:hypothetical protein